MLDFKGLDGLTGAAKDFTEESDPVLAPQLERKAQQAADDRSRAAEVYKTYQENIKKTELLQADILKGIRAHADIYELFLTAARALSYTISNREFIAQIEKELPIYYPEANLH